MSLITNYTSSPLAACTVNGAGRNDFPDWNVTNDAPAEHVVSARVELVSGTGTIRFGWDSDHTLDKTGRLTAYPSSNIFLESRSSPPVMPSGKSATLLSPHKRNTVS